MDYKCTQKGRLYNDTHAQCCSPNPSKHAIGAMLTVDSFISDHKNPSRVSGRCRNCLLKENRRSRREKKLNNVCQQCNLPAVFHSLCEWHWYRKKAGTTFKRCSRRSHTIYLSKGRNMSLLRNKNNAKRRKPQ